MISKKSAGNKCVATGPVHRGEKTRGAFASRQTIREKLKIYAGLIRLTGRNAVGPVDADKRGIIMSVQRRL